MSPKSQVSVTGFQKFLEEEMKQLQTLYDGLEKLLDDIMYTLCLKGYTRMVDANGKYHNCEVSY